MEIIRYKIAESLVYIANWLVGVRDPNSYKGHWVNIDNRTVFGKNYLESNASTMTLDEFWKQEAMWDKAEELQKVHGGFAVIQGEGITIYQDPTEIL